MKIVLTFELMDVGLIVRKLLFLRRRQRRLELALVCLMSSLYSSFRERDLTPNLATAWGWGSRAAFFWAGLDVIVIVWVFFRLPEPAGLTFGEIDRVSNQTSKEHPPTSIPVTGVEVMRQD